MVKAYLNYPNSRVVAHTNVLCGDVQKMKKARQRKIRVDQNSFSVEIARFERKEHRFRSQSQFNDMWLDIDFNDIEFEIAVLAHIHRLLSRQYKPFTTAQFEPHC